MFHSGSLSTPQDHLKTSVCIVTYNRAATIDLCLRSIENQVTPLDEIIVVDSSDNDDTRRILQQRKIIYKHIEKRLYQPQARNLSLSIAKGNVIAFVDDDVICSSAWLKNIIKGYSYDNVVGVGGPVIRCDETLRPMQEMKISNKNHNFFTFYGDVRVTPTWMPLKPVRTKLMMGGNMSFLKVELKEVGGFDEFYGEGGAYREETDPQIALIRKRYDFMYMPGAIAYHLVHSRGEYGRTTSRIVTIGVGDIIGTSPTSTFQNCQLAHHGFFGVSILHACGSAYVSPCLEEIDIFLDGQKAYGSSASEVPRRTLFQNSRNLRITYGGRRMFFAILRDLLRKFLNRTL